METNGGGASLYGKLAEPAFDLGVAVRAEQPALHRLLPDGLNGRSQPVRADSEPFRPRINVMELECAEEAVPIHRAILQSYTNYVPVSTGREVLITRASHAATVSFPVALALLFAYALSFGIVFSGSSNGLFQRHRL